MSSQDDEPAILALECYENKDFSGALEHLTELEGLVANNSTLLKRVQHNKAVVEFAASEYKQVSPFKQSVAQLAGVSFPEIDVTDYNAPFVIYNYAVLLYHLRYYYQCTVLLERLLLAGTAKDNKLQCRVVLLLLEATLCRRTYDKALEIGAKYAELMNANNELSGFFDRLVCRAKLYMGQKIQLNPDSMENAFVIAHQQYLMGDVKVAAHTLGVYRTLKYEYDLKTQGEDLWAAMNNNLGVIYMAVHKPYLASRYFQHSIKEHFKAMESEDSEILFFCKDRPLYVYNLALGLIAANYIEGAFECLVEAARHYPNNPRIWLRLAECCVKKCCADEVQQFSVKRLGIGPHARIILAKELKEKCSPPGESFAIPSMSLEFAALCLKNALTLLPNSDPPEDVTKPYIQAPPAPPINWRQRCDLRNSIMILECYVFLHLQDPISALVTVNELLIQPDLSNCHKAWAHMYAAEALVCLDKTVEAMEHLNPKIIHELISTLPPNMRDIAGVSVWAKAAVCHILRGDLVTAKKILLQINSPRVLPLQMYLEICTGNIENCHAILRKLQFNIAAQ